MISTRYHLFPALVVAITAVAIVSCSKTTPTPLEPVALSGPASYEKNCQLCHGAKGEGVKEMGPSVQRLDVRIPHDDQLRHIIRNGRGKMPPFHGMSDTELEAVIAYIKTL
jgi:mono/diheme cytochrome c family protein